MQNLWSAGKPQIPIGAHVMKTASTALIAFLNAARANPDAPIAFADCFTFTLATGPIAHLYQRRSAGRLQRPRPSPPTGRWCRGSNTRPRSGSRSTSSRSPSPRGRPISSTARRFSNALRDGAFDGATRAARPRVHDRARADADRRRDAVPRPGVDDRPGRAHQRDDHGRLRPRRSRLRHAAQPLFADLPAHALRFRLRHPCAEPTPRAEPSAPARPRASINFAGALASHAQGSIVFTSGVNANLRATVKSVAAGARSRLMYPLPVAARDRRRLHRLCRLRPHAGDLPVALHQSRQFPRLPLRAAAADRVLGSLSAISCEP